jgi:hypothetical protein
VAETDEMGEVEEKLEAYEVKREGEAEILMLKSNAVFFNPVQVPALLYWYPISSFFYCVCGVNRVMSTISSGFKSTA